MNLTREQKAAICRGLNERGNFAIISHTGEIVCHFKSGIESRQESDNRQV